KAPVQKAVLETGIENLFSWSTKAEATLQLRKQEIVGQQSILKAKYQGREIQIQIPFADPSSVENAMYCWCLLLYLGLDQDWIAMRMLHLEPIAMRLEFREGINQCTLINDSYNSDLSSLAIALNFLAQNSGHKKRTLIISDIYQSGLRRNNLYQKVANLLSVKSINKVIAVGSEITALEQYLPANIESSFYPSTEELLQHFPEKSFVNEAILIKGARVFGFERIAEKLSARIHRTVLQVDMNALANNIQVYRSQLKSGVQLMIVVKASAYGSGGFEVARFLELQKIDYLAVAYVDEGIELRKAGIKLPILVLNPDESSFQALFTWNLEPEIYSFALLKAFIQRVPDTIQSTRIHLKVDTGMHRLGFDPDDAQTIGNLLQEDRRIVVASILSHMAASDREEFREFSHEQARRFDKFNQELIGILQYAPMRHILNSGGISVLPQYQYEMVRLGIGLYGVDSNAEVAAQLQPVHTLKAIISQIKEIEAGESVGYMRGYFATKRQRIGIISIGYADGLFRSAGNGNIDVLVRGHKAKIIGHVCMDMSMIDLSEIPDAAEGDEVVIFGQNPSIMDLARQLDTIPYEIITSISNRVKRVFFREEA
ncbi:MAG: alanine racemase, partial [Saprospiraceae bacterium]